MGSTPMASVKNNLEKLCIKQLKGDILETYGLAGENFYGVALNQQTLLRSAIGTKYTDDKVLSLKKRPLYVGPRMWEVKL